MSESSESGGWLYDGLAAVRHEVRLRIERDVLVIFDRETVPLASLYSVDPTRPEYLRHDVPGWRVIFADPKPSGWESLPQPVRFGGMIDRMGLWRAAIVLGILSITAVSIGLWGADIAAKLIPFAWERQLGEAVTGDFGGKACRGIQGQAALDAMAIKLSPAGKPMRIRVIDYPEANAVALPGGQILIFRPLIDQASSPDEIAGVLAHEIGHVERRHVLTALVRRFGLALILGSGGKPGEYAQTLLDFRYGRSAEHEADEYSLDRLIAARISPAPTAALLGRLERDDGSPFLAYLDSHPPSRERRRLFDRAAKSVQDPVPAVDARQWSAIRRICIDGPS